MSIVPFKSSGDIATVESLSVALRAIQDEIGDLTAILKMDKVGHWIYGADATEVEEGSRWAANPFSFVHGYVAWGGGKCLGERMAPITAPLPEVDAVPVGCEKGWEKQVGLSLACVSGEDKGLNVRFATTSIGGKRAVQALAAAIAKQVDSKPTAPVPVVELSRDHYQHHSYGKVIVPVFEIVDWMSMDGEPVAKEEEAPKTRRRRSA
jgi:hypothetical protein